MNWLSIESLGLIAGCMTTSAFIPQVVKTYRTRSVKDISLRMYVFLCTGITLWIVYGFLIGSIAVIAANIASLTLTASILGMKIVFHNHSPRG
ncbi:MAG: SemiSWEET transporter [Desulfovibrio sp.]|nr:SemiSWEET transporter [Desulfovibrio sp.]